ncbi:MAG: DUF2834 domain-containing protein [Stenotrophobium sp.]
MKSSTIYLAICLIGTILSWAFLIAFVMGNGATPMLFLSSIFANHVASAVAADLFASAGLFIVFVLIEGRRLGMQRLWAYILAAFLGGLVFGAGLFFYLRAKTLERRASGNKLPA